MPINRTGTPSPYDGLKTLLGSPMRANDPLELSRLRNDQMREMRHNAGNKGANGYVTGANDSDLVDLSDDIESDPFTGAKAQQDVQDQSDLNSDILNYNRPDVTDMRNTELANKERLATAPARTAGEYNVESARVAAGGREAVANATNSGRYEMLARMMEAAQPGQKLSAGGVSVGSPAPNVTADNQYLNNLRTGKAHAPGNTFMGFGQQALDQAEIARIEGKQGSVGSDTPNQPPGQATGPAVGTKAMRGGVLHVWQPDENGQLGWDPVSQ